MDFYEEEEENTTRGRHPARSTRRKRRRLQHISGNAMSLPRDATQDVQGLPMSKEKSAPLRSSARQGAGNGNRSKKTSQVVTTIGNERRSKTSLMAKAGIGTQSKKSAVAKAGENSTVIPPTTPHRSRPLRSVPDHDDDDDGNQSFDEDPTPKAPSLGPTPFLYRTSSPDRSSTHSSQSASSSKRARSGSPSKLGDLQLSDIRVSIIEGGKIPDHGEALWRDLKRIGRGNKVIPWAVRHNALHDFDDDPEDVDRFFDLAEKDNGQKLGDDGLDHEECWARAVEVHEAAREWRNLMLSEAAWNSEVHSTLLRLALRGQWKSKGVWYRDATSVRIRDKSLLPTNKQSKMVDYVLVIEPDADLEACIREMMIAKRLLSINHAESEYLRFVLIGLSMETKCAAIDEDKADMQVATWIRAHYAKLKQLTPPATLMPVLPIVVAQGHDWKFMLAEMASPDHVVIHRELSLGATNSMLGIYQLLAAVRRLAKWVHDDYQAWFIKEVLGQ